MRDGEAAPHPRGHKVWGLLAYLLRTDRPPSRAELVSLLFGEADDPLAALRWNLSALRRLLGDATVEGDPLRLSLPPGTFVDVETLICGSWSEAVRVPGIELELLEGMSFSSSPAFEIWLADGAPPSRRDRGSRAARGGARAARRGRRPRGGGSRRPPRSAEPARRELPDAARAQPRRVGRRARRGAPGRALHRALPTRARDRAKPGAGRRDTDGHRVAHRRAVEGPGGRPGSARSRASRDQGGSRRRGPAVPAPRRRRRPRRR